ncbi:MAG: phenylalanine--tRNA ligase subunit beta [Acidaminococcaceae bacterium]|nr:phenylalanine--tRNA ligase subunit beta [Acidaminococcaceae bacterium]
MLASLKWMKEYVDINVTPEELADKLTGVGLEVEQVIHLGAGIKGVITGKVETIERHPNSDHLWICMMNLGQEELVQILTGAQNVQQYDIVPVAVVGSQLPSGMKLKKAKMRGLDSFGMLCSAEELGIDSKLLLPEQRSGIFILPVDTPIGIDVKSVLGLDDVVFDIDLTANRSDCFNMLGLAREAAAVLDTKLKTPNLVVEEKAAGSAKALAEVEIEATELCRRFALRVLKNIKIGPSPAWMQNYLRACGLRPISNVVDVTNYVMLELGQPMHAYDYDKVAGHKLIVRKATEGERLITLDKQERVLDSTMITIADAKHAVGLGGVMGGLETEVTEATVNVMLEAATFNGPSIRRTSKALGLRSEASSRFERGVDTALNNNALNRAAHLLEQMGACDTVAGIVEAYPVEYTPAAIRVTVEDISRRIGTVIAKDVMLDILNKLQFDVAEENGTLIITAPSWRQDITCDADISEEIARMHGFRNIAAHLPRLNLVQGRQMVIEDVRDEIQDYMAAAGLDEVMTYSFIHANAFDKMQLAADDSRRKAIEIINPISDEFKTMRTTMAPSLLATAAYNLARQNTKVGIFEVGRTFIPKTLPITEFPEEHRVLCAVLSGKRNELNWNASHEDVDFYDMKGILEGLMEKLQIADYKFIPAQEPFLHPGKSCAIECDGTTIGYFGEVHPTVQENFELGAVAYLLEIQIEPLVAGATTIPQYQRLPKFPSTSRDIAVVVPTEVTMAKLDKVIHDNGGKLLNEVKVFDLYTGKQVAEGCKSMAFNLTFQDNERTLTDADIDVLIKKIVDVIRETFQAKLRD